MLDVDRICGALDTKRVGRRIEHLQSTGSTNDEAWERIDAGLAPDGGRRGTGAQPVGEADGLVVFAEHQSAGRGRLGRRWESPRGASVLCSVALVDRQGELEGGELSLLAAVAARDAVVACTEVVPTIKWPNDLLVGGRKLGGILVESRVLPGEVRAYVVGVGINCLQQKGHIPAALAEKATSLELESVCAIDREAVAIALLRELDRWLAAPDTWTCETLRREWLARCEPMGQRIFLRHAGKEYSGSIVDIDPTAAMVVQLDEGGLRAFNAADTTIVGRGSAAAD